MDLVFFSMFVWGAALGSRSVLVYALPCALSRSASGPARSGAEDAVHPALAVTKGFGWYLVVLGITTLAAWQLPFPFFFFSLAWWALVDLLLCYAPVAVGGRASIVGALSMPFRAPIATLRVHFGHILALVAAAGVLRAAGSAMATVVEGFADYGWMFLAIGPAGILRDVGSALLHPHVHHGHLTAYLLVALSIIVADAILAPFFLAARERIFLSRLSTDHPE